MCWHAVVDGLKPGFAVAGASKGVVVLGGEVFGLPVLLAR